MKKIFVFGSLNMDLVISCDRMPQGGETLSGEGFFTNPGGKGANQTAACGKLGGRVAMCGHVGADAFGKMCIRDRQLKSPKRARSLRAFLFASLRAGTS